MRVMMDKENIGAILQEMSDERNIQTDSQRKVADFFVNLVVRLEKGDPEAIKMLNMTPQELQQMASQNTMQTEAFENLRSKASGLFGGDPVKKRYDLLIQSLNKHIWEFTQDVKNTKIEDVAGYNQMFAELQKIEPALQAKGGFFQKIGYGVGRGVGTVAKIGSVSVLGAALGGLGLPAYAIGGILGGGLSVLKNSQSTKMDTKTKLKQALIGAGLGAMVGYAFSKLRAMTDGVDFSSSPDADTASTTPDADTASTTPDGSYDVGDTLMGGKVEVLYNGDDGVVVSSKQRIITSLGDSKGITHAAELARLRGTAALAEILGTDTLRGVNAEYVDGGDGYVYSKVSIATDGTIDPSFETTQQDFDEPVINDNVGTGETPDLERLQNMPRIPNETFSYTDNAKGYLLSNNPKGISIAVDTNILDTASAFKDENTALKYFSKLTGLSVDEVANQMQEIGTDTNRGRGALNFGKTSYYYFPKR